MNHLASRFRRHELEVAQAQLLARVLRDADVPAEKLSRATAAGGSCAAPRSWDAGSSARSAAPCRTSTDCGSPGPTSPASRFSPCVCRGFPGGLGGLGVPKVGV